MLTENIMGVDSVHTQVTSVEDMPRHTQKPVAQTYKFIRVGVPPSQVEPSRSVKSNPDVTIR